MSPRPLSRPGFDPSLYLVTDIVIFLAGLMVLLLAAVVSFSVGYTWASWASGLLYVGLGALSGVVVWVVKEKWTTDVVRYEMNAPELVIVPVACALVGACGLLAAIHGLLCAFSCGLGLAMVNAAGWRSIPRMRVRAHCDEAKLVKGYVVVRSMVEAGNFDVAIERIDSLMSGNLSPAEASLYLAEKGLALLVKRNNDAAKKILMDLRERPPTARAILLAGMIDLADYARTRFRRAEVGFRHVELLGAARFSARGGWYREASEDLAVFRAIQAFITYKMGGRSQAICDLRSVALDPAGASHGWASYALGRVLRSLGDSDKADLWFVDAALRESEPCRFLSEKRMPDAAAAS